ncbi:hypothetical protein DICVIV_10868, partial [Dictyocaulus viviparus]
MFATVLYSTFASSDFFDDERIFVTSAVFRSDISGNVVKSARYLNTSDGSSSELVAPSVWSILPDTSKDMPTPTSLVAITDPTSAFSQNPYYNSGYGTSSYGMYGGTSATASYYQQVATGLRVQNASFPYAIGTATPSTYYGSSYPSSFDYSAYNPQYYNGMRAGYYGSSYPSSFDYSAYNPQYYNGMRAGYYGNAFAAGASAYTTPTISMEASSDLSAFALKCDKKASKSSKKKKTESCSPIDAHFARVFVWELDDICALSTAFLNGITRKAPQYSRAATLLQNFAARIVALSFPSDQLDESDLCNVDDAALEDSLSDGVLSDGRCGVDMIRRVASKYLSFRQLYLECALKPDTQGCNYSLIERCGMSSQKDEISEAFKQIELLFGGRSEAARRCLEVVVQRSVQ